MATGKEIKEALDELSESSVFDKEILKKEVVLKALKSRCPNLSEEDLEKQVNTMLDSGSYYVTEIDNSLNEIASMVKSIPTQVTSLVTLVSTIPAAFSGIAMGSGTAAGAQTVLSVKSQGAILKTQIRNCLSLAVKLDIDIPGIDAVISAAKTLKSIL